MLILMRAFYVGPHRKQRKWCAPVLEILNTAIVNVRADLASVPVETRLPWNADALVGWDIVGMNHYHVEGERRLFVAMTNGFHCIRAEGADESEVFKVLAMAAL